MDFVLTSDDICLDHEGGLAQLPEQIFRMDGRIRGLCGDGHNGAAVGWYDGVDGQNVCLIAGEYGQQLGEGAGFILH